MKENFSFAEQKTKAASPEIDKQRESAKNVLSLPFLRLPHFNEDPTNTLLVMAGKKNGSIVSFGKSWEISQPNLKFTDEEIQSTENLLTEAGIVFKRLGNKENRELPGGRFSAEYQQYAIGKNENDVSQIVEELEKPRNEARDHHKLGSLLGFPSSAVTAFTNFNLAQKETPGASAKRLEKKFLIKKEDLPAEYLNDDTMAFLHFRLSKDYWQEEFEVIRDWANTIKKLAPEYYNQKISEYKEKLKKQINKEY